MIFSAAVQNAAEPVALWRVRPLYNGNPVGGWAVCQTLGYVVDMIQDSDGGDGSYEVQKIEMTHAEIEAMDDFAGW